MSARTDNTDPFAMVRPDSAHQTGLLAIGWTVTDSMDGWDHMEPPPVPPTHEGWVARCQETWPSLEWEKSWTGIGLVTWGFQGERKAAVSYVPGVAKPYKAWVGIDRGPIEHTFHFKTFKALAEAVAAVLPDTA